MEKINIICLSCESEYQIKQLYSDLEVTYCPYCGEHISTEEEE